MQVDIKKLAHLPNGSGHRLLRREAGERNKRRDHRGYAYLHHAVDSYSRVAYSEILENERKETAADLWLRADAFFASIGVTLIGVMTDNEACYVSHAYAAALRSGVRHRRTRLYRPQTNGKVE